MPSVPLTSVLWRCWLGGRKSICAAKTKWWGAGKVICLEQGADLHGHSLSLTFVKSRLVLPFWYWLTRVVPEKGPLNKCVFKRKKTFVQNWGGFSPCQSTEGKPEHWLQPEKTTQWHYLFLIQPQRHGHRSLSTRSVTMLFINICTPVGLHARMHAHTHTRLTALFQDYLGKPVPER